MNILIINSKCERANEHSVQFECPSCNNVSESVATALNYKYFLFNLIPFLWHTDNRLQCGSCQKVFELDFEPAKAEMFKPKELKDYVNLPPTKLEVVFTILAVFSCLFPVWGLLISVPAFFINRRKKGKYKTVTTTCLYISIGLACFVAAIIMFVFSIPREN